MIREIVIVPADGERLIDYRRLFARFGLSLRTLKDQYGVRWNKVRVQNDNPAYRAVREFLLDSDKIHAYMESRHYSEEELNKASFFSIHVRNLVEFDSTESKSSFDIGDSCTTCGLPVVQSRPLVVNRRIKGQSLLYALWSGELIVRNELAQSLGNQELRGFRFEPVLDSDLKIIKDFKQLVITSTAPAMSKRTTLLREGHCKTCGTTSFGAPFGVTYEKDVLPMFADVNLTMERMGGVPGFSSPQRVGRHVIVSKRFMKSLGQRGRHSLYAEAIEVV